MKPALQADNPNKKAIAKAIQWIKKKQANAKAVEQERKIREELVAQTFTGDSSKFLGSKTVTFGDDDDAPKLTFSFKETFSVDPAILPSMLDDMTQLVSELNPTLTQEQARAAATEQYSKIFRFKPELNMSVYNALGEKLKSVVDVAVSSKPSLVGVAVK